MVPPPIETGQAAPVLLLLDFSAGRTPALQTWFQVASEASHP